MFKTNLRLSLLILPFIVLMISCGNDQGKISKPISKGSICEVVVMAPKKWYDNEVFKTTLKEVIEYEQYGLPQPETTFDMTFVPLENQSIRYNEDKTILKFVPYNGNTYFTYVLDSMAKPQVIMTIGAKSSQEALAEFIQDRDQIKALVRDTNIKKVDAENKLYGLIDFKKENLGSSIGMNIPISFKKAIANAEKEDKNFLWYRSETNTVSSNIWVAVLPYRPINDIQQFVSIRDSIVSNNIRGDFPNTKMSTLLKVFPPVFQTYKYHGMPAGELRGQWEFDKEFKGGPFDAIFLQDTINKKTIVAEGFVYAPGQKKRNALFKLESIIRSVEIK